MIIECQTCHARFRLDESKIKGRGARVKCRKCGEGIIVLKEGGTGSVSPDPGREGGLDLSSALRESDAAVSPPVTPPPPPDNLIPFPASPRAVEPEAAVELPSLAGPIEQKEKPAVPAAAEKDEVDLAFDRFLATGDSPSLADTAESGTPATTTEEIPQDIRIESPEAPFTEEEPALPPVAAIVEPPFEEPTPAYGESGFLISDSETLDFLKEEHRVAEPPRSTDISFAISADQVDMEATSLREPQATPLREPKATPAASPERTADAADLLIEGNATPQGEPHEVDVPPHREEEEAPAAAVRRPSPATPPPARSPRPASSVSFAGGAAAALLAIALAAAGYLGFTPSGRTTLERVAPGAAAMLGLKDTGMAVSRYEVKNMIGYYESGASSPRILIIKGQVTNLSATEKSGIRILAALLDGGGKTLAESTVYAGNVVSGERLKKGNREALEKELANPMGDGLANMHVPPGKSIPFTVLFFDAPENIDSYRLEAKDIQ